MKSGLIFGQNKEIQAVKIGQIRRVLKGVNSFLKKFGKWCVVLAVLAVLWLVGPVILQEIRFAFVQTNTGRTVEKLGNTDMTPKFFQEPTKTEKASWAVPDENYSVYIPKIAAKSKVVPNVDPWDKDNYSEALKHGVAAANELATPGEVGTTYLFAHSVGTRADFARYNAIFYLLHKLEAKDAVEVVYKGELFKYQVWEKRIIDATDLSYFAPQETEERLVLQTCYPPGTSWKRLIVVAKRV